MFALTVLMLFGFHFPLFIGLRLAPAGEVNMVNHFWSLLIVVLKLSVSMTLRDWQLLAVLGRRNAYVFFRGLRKCDGCHKNSVIYSHKFLFPNIPEFESPPNGVSVIFLRRNQLSTLEFRSIWN